MVILPILYMKAGLTKNSRTDGYGQATASCITDAYCNHGWVSVYAAVQSAFVTATMGAIAAACAAKNCLTLVKSEDMSMGPFDRDRTNKLDLSQYY